MSKLQLSMAMGSNERSRPVIDGRIQPDGIDLMSSALHGSEIFWRQLKFAEFEALAGQTVFVSATPGPYELTKTQGEIVEMVGGA